MKQNYLIGLDVGTTSIKGILLDITGHFHMIASEEYTLETQGDDICELDPESYWLGTQNVIRYLLDKSSVPAEKIGALAFSCQGETLICVDENGKPLRKAIVWLDNRSVKEADKIIEKIGAEQIHQITGQPVVLPIWPSTKILWLKENEPEVYKKSCKFLMVADYLVFKLTGKYATEESLVSSTLYFNFREKVWWPSMLDYLGISSEQLPKVYPCGTAVAKITRDAVQLTGLSENCLVVTGAYDHPAGAIGAGNIETEIVTETTGGSIAMCITLDEPVLDAQLNLSCQCHAIQNMYFLMPYGQTAGMVLRWFRDNFAEKEIEQAKAENLDSYHLLMELAAKVPLGCDGLTMLPHLMGTGSPEFDPKAKGVFYGVTLQMTRGHFVRAILESVVCIVKANVDPLIERGFSFKEIRVLGGGAKSDLWNQIKADMLGIPIVTVKIAETPSLGAAILAGLGSGIFENIQQGCERFVKIDKKFIPDPLKKDSYNQVYQRYQKLYQVNKPIWTK